MMKQRNAFYILAVLLLAGLISCKKDTSYRVPSSVMVVNTMVGTERVVPNPGFDRSILYYLEAKHLYYGLVGTYTQFLLEPGAYDLAFYNYPDTTVHDAPVKTVSLKAGEAEIYTMFLTGSIQHPDTVLVKEQFPVLAKQDSSFGLRVINLSSYPNPVVVEVDGEADPVATDLVYKSRSPFILRSAKSDVTEYTVRFKDQLTNTEIANYTIPNNFGFTIDDARFRHLTIALIGSTDYTSGTFAIKCLLVPHYFKSI